MNEIKKYRYPNEPWSYIRISEVSEELKPEFLKWMRGQTVPIVPDLDPQDAVYEWDWDRWLVKQKTGREVWD